MIRGFFPHLSAGRPAARSPDPWKKAAVGKTAAFAGVWTWDQAPAKSLEMPGMMVVVKAETVMISTKM